MVKVELQLVFFLFFFCYTAAPALNKCTVQCGPFEFNVGFVFFCPLPLPDETSGAVHHSNTCPRLYKKTEMIILGECGRPLLVWFCSILPDRRSTPRRSRREDSKQQFDGGVVCSNMNIRHLIYSHNSNMQTSL